MEAQPVREPNLMHKWIKQSRRIYAEVLDLIEQRRHHDVLIGFLKKDLKVEDDNGFLWAFQKQYYCYISLGIRRQLDRSRRTISLRRLLEDILVNTQAVTLRRYQILCVSRNIKSFDVRKEFSSYTNADGVTLSRRRIRGDLRTVKLAGNVVTRYVNKRVAHSDRFGPRKVPGSIDLHLAVFMLEGVARRYLQLLTGLELASPHLEERASSQRT